jgi:glutaredoxin
MSAWQTALAADSGGFPKACGAAGTLFALFLYLPDATGAELFKWIDADGKVHYSDSALAETKSKRLALKINSVSGPPVVSQLSTASPVGTSASRRVRLLSTTWCGYCKRAAAFLRARGTPFEELDVEKSIQGKREYDVLGGRGVPIIMVGDRRMDGYDQTALAAMLRDAGM